MWKVKLRKIRATWHYFTENPQGGGFGSNHVGSKSAALTRATRNIPEGALYQLYVDDKLTGTHNNIMKRFNPLKPQSESSAPITKPRKAPPRVPGSTEFTTTLTENDRRDGLELRFDAKPADEILCSLKTHKWFWSRRRMCWIHKNTPENREFAQRFLNPSPDRGCVADQPQKATPTPAIPEPQPANILPVQFTPEPPVADIPVTAATVAPWRARLIRQN